VGGRKEKLTSKKREKGTIRGKSRLLGGSLIEKAMDYQAGEDQKKERLLEEIWKGRER